MARMKIVIPRDVDGQLSLSSNIIKQHKKLKNESPLLSLKAKTIENTVSKAPPVFELVSLFQDELNCF